MNGFERLEQPQERVNVVISRFWNHPNITITVNRDKIELIADIHDFINALYEELEKPVLKQTLKQRIKGEIPDQRLRDRLYVACDKATEKIKYATLQVM